MLSLALSITQQRPMSVSATSLSSTCQIPCGFPDVNTYFSHNICISQLTGLSFTSSTSTENTWEALRGAVGSRSDASIVKSYLDRLSKSRPPAIVRRHVPLSRLNLLPMFPAETWRGGGGGGGGREKKKQQQTDQ